MVLMPSFPRVDPYPKPRVLQTLTKIVTDEGAEGYYFGRHFHSDYFGGHFHGDQDGLLANWIVRRASDISRIVVLRGGITGA